MIELPAVVRQIGTRRLSAAAEGSQRPLVNDVLDMFAELSPRQPLRAGLRVRFGWSMLTLVESDEGLVVCEPDFDRDPLRDVRPTLAVTLRIAAEQATLARRLGVVPIDATFDSFVVVGHDALASPAVQLYRDPQPATGEDSGWSVTTAGAPAAGDDPDAFDAVRVYTLLRTRPAVLPLLALPLGFAVTIQNDRVLTIIDGKGQGRTL